MQKLQQPSPDNHPQFDAMCAAVDDWQTLPEVGADPTMDTGRVDEDGVQESTLDGHILAGLVTPF